MLIFRDRYLLNFSFKFVWYDLWIGIFIDVEKHAIYVCPFPCCVIKITCNRMQRTWSLPNF